MTEFLNLATSGILMGFIYSLIALGIVVIYKCTAGFNFAQGFMMLMGAYFCGTILVIWELPLWVAILGTVVFSIFLGWVIERGTLRFLIGQPILSLLIMTLAIGHVLQGICS